MVFAMGCIKYREFEAAFADKLGANHALAVTSGTAALKVALTALGIGAGDEVITQCHTFVATVEAIIDTGATPVITEIDETLNMDPKDLEAKITSRTKCVIPVHMLGVPARMQEIMNIADTGGVPVLEDTAQALGGSYRSKYLGTIGKVGTFSFDHGKLLTTGEGGMIITDDEKLYLKARAYHDHGHESNPAFPRGQDTRSFAGFNFRMNELQGAIGLAQLNKIDYAIERQRANKARIKSALKSFKNLQFRELPDENGDAGDTLAFFCDDQEKAAQTVRALQHEGLGTKNLPDALSWHFSGTWDHMLENVSNYWKKSEHLLRRAIAIPIKIRMDDEIELTVDKLRRALGPL